MEDREERIYSYCPAVVSSGRTSQTRPTQDNKKEEDEEHENHEESDTWAAVAPAPWSSPSPLTEDQSSGRDNDGPSVPPRALPSAPPLQEGSDEEESPPPLPRRNLPCLPGDPSQGQRGSPSEDVSPLSPVHPPSPPFPQGCAMPESTPPVLSTVLPLPPPCVQPSVPNLPQPCATALPQPCARPLPQPCGTALPQPCATALPQPCAAALPQPCATALPQPCAAALPQPCAAALPQPCATALPQPCGTALPQPCGTALPQPCGTALPQPCARPLPQPCVQPPARHLPQPGAPSPAPPLPRPCAIQIPRRLPVSWRSDQSPDPAACSQPADGSPLHSPPPLPTLPPSPRPPPFELPPLPPIRRPTACVAPTPVPPPLPPARHRQRVGNPQAAPPLAPSDPDAGEQGPGVDEGDSEESSSTSDDDSEDFISGDFWENNLRIPLPESPSNGQSTFLPVSGGVDGGGRREVESGMNSENFFVMDGVFLVMQPAQAGAAPARDGQHGVDAPHQGAPVRYNAGLPSYRDRPLTNPHTDRQVTEAPYEPARSSLPHRRRPLSNDRPQCSPRPERRKVSGSRQRLSRDQAPGPDQRSPRGHSPRSDLRFETEQRAGDDTTTAAGRHGQDTQETWSVNTRALTGGLCHLAVSAGTPGFGQLNPSNYLTTDLNQEASPDLFTADLDYETPVNHLTPNYGQEADLDYETPVNHLTSNYGQEADLDYETPVNHFTPNYGQDADLDYETSVNHFTSNYGLEADLDYETPVNHLTPNYGQDADLDYETPVNHLKPIQDQDADLNYETPVRYTLPNLGKGTTARPVTAGQGHHRQANSSSIIPEVGSAATCRNPLLCEYADTPDASHSDAASVAPWPQRPVHCVALFYPSDQSQTAGSGKRGRPIPPPRMKAPSHSAIPLTNAHLEAIVEASDKPAPRSRNSRPLVPSSNSQTCSTRQYCVEPAVPSPWCKGEHDSDICVDSASRPPPLPPRRPVSLPPRTLMSSSTICSSDLEGSDGGQGVSSSVEDLTDSEEESSESGEYVTDSGEDSHRQPGVQTHHQVRLFLDTAFPFF